MALVTRYSDRIYGNITFIGNTLGLSRDINDQQSENGRRIPGTYNLAGAFTTTDLTSRCGTVSSNLFPFGTTCVLPLTTMYQLSSSETQLTLPSNTEVIYAELIWGGSYRYPSITIENQLGNPISFRPPGYTTPLNILPVTATSGNFKMVSDANIYAYCRSANVTGYVKAAGSGTYWVGRIPAVISATDINDSYGFGGSGWTLAVIYRYLLPGYPLKNITLYVGGVPIIANTSYAEATLTNFVTPSLAPINGRLLLSAFEGDYSITGEQVFFATQGNVNLITPLSGPNNLVNNFFASQINNDQGTLNTTSGTFSTRNHLLNSTGTAYIGTSAARQGWDITNIAIPSANLSINQTSATLRISTVGDSILLNGAAVVIDTKEPLIEITKTTNIRNVVLGDEVTYTLSIRNVGTAQAENILIKDIIPTGMAFIPGSITINSGSATSYSVITGIPISNLMPNATSTIRFKLRVTSTTGITSYDNTALATYAYSLQPLPYQAQSNMVSVYPIIPGILIEKFASPAVVTADGTVSYSIRVTNVGNVTLHNLRIYDTDIPLGLSVIESSLLVNNQPPVGSLSTGILISQINEGAHSMITFNAKINNILFAAFENTAYGSGNYTVNTGDIRPIDDTSTIVRTDTIDVTLDKTVNKTQALENDTLTYTITITNNSSIPISNIRFNDIIDANTTFLDGDVPYSELSTGVIITSLPGKDDAPNNVYTLNFRVTINNNVRGTVTNTVNLVSYEYTDSLGRTYTGSPQTDTAVTTVQDIDVVFNKSVSPSKAQIGDTVTYTLAVYNNSSIDITDVRIRDASLGLSNVTISQIMLNNTLIDPQPSLSSGIVIPSIAVGQSAIITFKALVLNSAPDIITNTASLDYSYISGSTTIPVTDIPSPETTLVIVQPRLTVEKFANQTILIKDGTTKFVQYTVYVKNAGNIAIDNVIFTDSLPVGMSYQSNSTYIDAVGPSDNSPEPIRGGIALGTINSGATVTVVFTVDVIL